jgi:chemotaxis protein methyltransferase CheR
MEKLTNKDFYALSDIFHDLTGIKYSTDKIYLFENRLSKFVGEWGGFSNYNDFISKLKSDPDLRNRFINELTTNFTFFFRESIHFYFLKYIVNKKFIKEKEVRIWSAAASGGHEAYSMAISLLGRHNNVSTNFKILATDIATEKIEFAIKGVYKLEEINGYLNKESILKFFNIKNNQYYVKNFLKSHITFKILNLMDPYPFHKKFHIIF